ncbi:sialic acid-binding Ig-like lectin 8 [Scyliorhinus torazame]|uniref:sialic acid-binding Ig-like lectin 8 n=1 Tax=Scyliorhinus torazame TaxID=75743 RepID=UPI003B595513
MTEGNARVIICSVESFPASNLTWRHLNVTMNRASSNNELWLVIPHVTSRNTGAYECVAENEHGAVEGSITITVERRDSKNWTVGLLTAGVILSGFLAGIFIFIYVRNTWDESRCSCFPSQGHTDKPDNLLYATINFSKGPNGDGTVHRSEVTEYAEIRFQRNCA